MESITLPPKKAVRQPFVFSGKAPSKRTNASTWETKLRERLVAEGLTSGPPCRTMRNGEIGDDVIAEVKKRYGLK